MNKIYAAGAICIVLPQYTTKGSRLWSLFDNFEAAEATIMSNCGDFFEHYYNYALIEEIVVHDRVSVYTPVPKQWWYKADFVDESVVISKIDIPKELQNISHWWVG
jgi:hypothetical protein